MANITISPLSKSLILESNSVYDYTVSITNNDDSSVDFEMYTSPYSYEQKNITDKDTASTQISKWITFKGPDGFYSDNPHLTAGPHETVEVAYRISTPNGIPASDQYAVIFARTITPPIEEEGAGIHAEISPGIIIYGHTDEEIVAYDESITNNFSFSPAVAIPVILLLTFLTIWVIVVLRKRKER